MQSPEPQSVPRVETHWSRITPGSREHHILTLLGEQYDTALAPRSLSFEDGVRIETEAMDDRRSVVVQIVANQGNYKPAFRNKVMADAFKLLWLRSRIPSAPRAVLVLSEPVLQAANGWVGTAIVELGVEILVYDGRRLTPYEGIVNARAIQLDEVP